MSEINELSEKLDGLEKRLQALEDLLRAQTEILKYQIKLLETLESNYQPPGARKEQVRMQFTQMRNAVKSATGGNPQVMAIFDNVLQSVMG